MIFLPIGRVKPGAKLGKSILSTDNRTLLAENVILTPMFISKLKKLGVLYLYVKDGGENMEYDIITEQTRLAALKETKKVMQLVERGQNIVTLQIFKVVKRIMDELLSRPNILVSLNEVRVMKDYTFGHCVNVCVLSLACGAKCGYSTSKLRDLAIGALLHDIGKSLIPANILEKPGKLNWEEFNIIKTHSYLGYSVLKQNWDISSEAAQIAYMHHEKFDGSGYPQGLKGGNIAELARIVAIADVYDALTTDRVYRKRFLPHEAIEIISAETGRAFDPIFTKIFLESVAPYPVGTRVVLNNGLTGFVKHVSQSFPSRPVIKIYKYPDYFAGEIDLLQERTIFIKDILE